MLENSTVMYLIKCIVLQKGNDVYFTIIMKGINGY